MHKRLSLLGAILLSLFAALPITGRDFHLSLNQVPILADSVAQKLYITLEPTAPAQLKATLSWDTAYTAAKLNGQPLTATPRNFVIDDWHKPTHSLTLTDAKGGESRWTLVFTTLPLFVIEAQQEKLYNLRQAEGNPPDDVKREKFPSHLTVIDARFRTEGKALFASSMKLRVRGATAAGKPKKPFAIELTDAQGNERDARLLGYRNDGDWILDAMFNDRSRMRNRLLFDLWNAMSDLPYAKDNDHQANGTHGEYVEVFMLDDKTGKLGYHGLYCFTDKIDRKKLNLKKTAEATNDSPEAIRGMLWKAEFNTQATTLTAYTEDPRPNRLLWEEKWVQQFPDDRPSQADFTPIARVIDVVGKNSSDENFFANFEKVLYYDNVIDYIILTQAFQGMDNLQKNYYLSLRNATKDDRRLLITPWDLDATIGRDAGGDPLDTDPKWIAFGEKLGGINWLIHRLTHRPPKGFATRFNNRWQYLKTHALSLDSIRHRMNAYAELFVSSGAWEREKKNQLSDKGNKKMADDVYEEIEFMMNFLKRNYEVFDKKVASWKPEAYTPPTPKSTPALYIVGHEQEVEKEGNKGTVPAKVSVEPIADIDRITYDDARMTIIRKQGSTAYALSDISKVHTQPQGFNPAVGFVPKSHEAHFDFDTQSQWPGLDEAAAKVVAPDFAISRTIQIQLDPSKGARVLGNTEGITVEQKNGVTTISSPHEGMHYLLTGQSAKASLVLRGTHPARITLDKARLTPATTAIHSEITAPVQLITTPNTRNELSGVSFAAKALVSGQGALRLTSATNRATLLSSTDDIDILSGALNLFASGADSKGIVSAKHLRIAGGSIRAILTGDGTAGDDNFFASLYPQQKYSAAVAAHTLSIEGGRLLVKTLGTNAIGCVAGHEYAMKGGEVALSTFDDALIAQDNVKVDGGELLATSLTDDACQSAGLTVNGGTVWAFGPHEESAFDVNGNSFQLNGGTLLGVAKKTERPNATASKQAAVHFSRGASVKAYVRLTTEDGQEVARFETPIFAKTSIVYSSPALVKGKKYVLATSDDNATFTTLQTLVAE